MNKNAVQETKEQEEKDDDEAIIYYMKSTNPFTWLIGFQYIRKLPSSNIVGVLCSNIQK
jgi:hypothetical protein